MKSNKIDDFTKFFKPILIVAFSLIVVCAFLLGFFGFNKGVDFTGGTQLVVDFTLSNIDAENNSDLQNAQNKVKNILSKKGIVVNSFQVLGEYSTKQFAITFRSCSNDILNDIRLEINQEFNDSSAYRDLGENEKNLILNANEDLTKKTTQVSSFVSPTVLISIISSLLFLIAVITIYSIFRVKLRGAVTIAFGALFDVLLTLTFIGLMRLQINRYIFVVLAIVICLSLYQSANLMFNIKDNAKNPHNLSLSNKEIANLTVQKSYLKDIFVSIGIFALALIWCIFGTSNILFNLLALIIGVAVVLASHLFVVPAFWVAITRQKETFTKQGVASVNSETKVVKVENTLNNQDSQAQVIEVDDEDNN